VSRKVIKWIVQIVATFVFLYLALRKIDTSQLKEIARGIYFWPLLIIPFLLFADLIINSYRILSLYRFYGVETKLFKILTIKLQGFFFSLIFPLLGDAFKIQSFKNIYGSSYWKNSLVVLLDRLIYTFGLTIVILPILLLALIEVISLIKFIILALLVVEVIVLLVLNRPEIFKSIVNLLHKIHPFFRSWNLNFDKREGYWKEISYNTAIAIFRHGLIAIVYLCIAYSLLQKFDFNIAAFFIVIFFIMISRIIPISVGGIGLSEYIAVAVFPQIGIPADYAFSIAFLMSTIMILQGLLGGVSYVRNRVKTIST